MVKVSLNYILIPLRNGNEIIHAKIDKEDVPLVLQYNWSYTTGYARAKLGHKSTSMHRLVLGLESMDTQEVDHINRDKLDNRKGNLRICTRADNNRYAIHKKGKNTYRGVYQVSENSFKVLIATSTKRIRVGSYKTLEEGAIAYNQAAIKYHGKFAVLNEIPEMVLDKG